jgi:MSHA biogenesis protein MshK
MASRLVPFVGLISMLLDSSARAETLVDPTRPPAQNNSIATPIASQVVSSPPSGLQSILISRTRRAAIIDGKTIALGQLYGESRLVEVNESSVVVMDSHGRRVLKLFPEVSLVKKVDISPSKLPDYGVQTDQNNNPPVKHQEKK